MLLGDALNVFLGLALTFAVVAGLASSVCEALASVLKWRANTLLAGIKDLLNDQSLSGLAKEVLDHAALNPRAGDAAAAASYKLKPSYVPPKQFASALLDVIQQTSTGVPQSLQNAIASIQDPQIKTLLQGFYDRAAGDVQKVHDDVAAWFDSGMDRLSGAYKRKSQLVLFIVSLVLAALLNVDAFHLAAALWAHPADMAALSASIAEGNSAEQNLSAAAKAFPMGWPATYLDNPFAWASAIGGWFATAFASLFGAPFWFDVIQKVARIKGTGPDPRTKAA